MTDEANLKWIRCVQTGSLIAFADEDFLNQLNDAIRAGKIANQVGSPVTQTISAGLVNEKRSILYVVENGIPNMIYEESISLNQLKDEEK